jgi:hypothetical protein
MSFQDYYELRSRVREIEQSRGSRQTSEVEFAFVAESQTDADQLARELTQYLDVAPDVARLETRPATMGRGFSSFGIALIVLGISGDTISVAQFVGWLWRKIRGWSRSRSGPEPVISLGAAKYLCLADLAMKVGDEEAERAVAVCGSEVGPSTGVDIDHTGSDLFFFLFATDAWTWAYVIDSLGQVIFSGRAAPLAQNVASYAGTDWTTAPQNLPHILDDADAG